MRQKRKISYKVDLTGKPAAYSAVLMGVAFFMTALNFFALTDVTTLSLAQILIGLSLPLLAQAAWFVALKGTGISVAKLYAIICALLCFSLALQTLLWGSVLRMVLGMIWYVAAGALVVTVAWGIFPYRVFTGAVFIPPLLVRSAIWLTNYGIRRIGESLPELAGIFCLLALCLLPLMLKPAK